MCRLTPGNPKREGSGRESFSASYAPALLLLEIPGCEDSNALLLLYLLLIVQLSDVLQYVFGKLFGRTKLAPVVSPSKTVEGLVGGGVATTLIGGSLASITPFTDRCGAKMEK